MDTYGTLAESNSNWFTFNRSCLYLPSCLSLRRLCDLICATTACQKRSNLLPSNRGQHRRRPPLPTFQSYIPSEPTARVEGLPTIEAPIKPSRTLSEALAFLRSWRQQVLTVVHDLGGNPEPLKLYSTLRTLISSLVASDNSFAMEVSQIYRQTGIKTLCNDVCLLTTIDLLEVELASRAQEEEEERRKQKNANVAIASFTSTGSAKTSTKPICRNFMTENGCNKGGQCTFLHPTTVGRCLRCGSTKHAVADCKRPRKDSAGTSSAKGKGKGKSPSLPRVLLHLLPLQRLRRRLIQRRSLAPIQKQRVRLSLRHLQHHPLLKQCTVSCGKKIRRKKKENNSPLQRFSVSFLSLPT